MTYYYNDTKTPEDTVLDPKQTTFTVDCWLQDTDEIYQCNAFGEYSFTFQPKQSYDHSLVMEHLETAKRQVEMMKPPWSTKVVRGFYRNDKGEFICNQLFAPSVDVKVPHPSELHGKVATVTCHLRDAADGTIYLNASYVHVHPTEQPKAVMMELVNDGDVLDEIDF